MITAIIAAAGQGRRMGSVINKVFLPLLGEPVVAHSVRKLASHSAIHNIVVVSAAEEVEQLSMLLTSLALEKPWQVLPGGSERQYSIAAALKAAGNKGEDVILVHDGARPLVSTATITAIIDAAIRYGAAGTAVPVKDTIKTVDEYGFVTGTPARQTLWAIQTPQAFRADLLHDAYDSAAKDKFLGTDDASLVERMGLKVKLVQGSYDNLKITTPEDLIIAEALLGKGQNNMRIGTGYDVHRLVKERKLILGGVEIANEYGLDGHSDADVLLHAIKDAMLGAAGLGDIGRHFPDTDAQFKGISSMVLLARVRDILAGIGYKVNNVDATIIAEKPKLAPYIPEMNANIAAMLKVEVEKVNVKATTTEGLGFTGRREGIAAQAVATIVTV